TTLIPIQAGATATIDDSFFASYVANTGAMTLVIDPLARLDVPGLLLALDRYPYGCAEQVFSRAPPLLYLNDVAKLIGMAGAEKLSQTVTDAIANPLSKQNSGGGFGLWAPLTAAMAGSMLMSPTSCCAPRTLATRCPNRP
ncbi:MAG: hypothetical protein MO852_15320, partial [Candidatus Devosia euplotis]|nr:hypothetical protein [Candidatus Devosia euplotis]